MIRIFLLMTITVQVLAVRAQNYNAIHGSPGIGSLGVHNNPASILMSPFKWDLTLFGVQGKCTTNLLTVYNYSLLSNPVRSQYRFDDGDYKRFGRLSVNLNLLNARISLGRKAAIAFGMNIRSTSSLSTGPYNYSDTLKSTGDFFKINNPSNSYSGEFTSASWAEVYASYSRTLIDDETKRLNAGISVKINKGLSGLRAELNGGRFNTVGNNRYSLTGGEATYRYSSNYDSWNKNNSSSSNIEDFLRNTEGGISFDAGLEYLIKPMVVKNVEDGDDYYDYEWKIGLSLLDAGFSRYRYSNQSRVAGNFRQDITNVQLDNKFDSTITSAALLNDSMATLAADFTGLAGKFRIIHPMRIVLNIDRFIYRNFYVNAELSLNLPGSWFNKWYHVQEINFLTLTPRWETTRFSVYLPVQVTSTKRVWIGGAFKAGPLLVGIHNWANLFAKNTIQNGGGYIALILRSPGRTGRKYDKRLDCPSF